ncbi:TRAP transporter small permease [Paracoccus sp. SCSIO 75233]|uniref:TRAP transporter small permease n=1 Tax=Paracoccus sp. SCSIO 75233 TaxID=3017782 RepID=UPI0022F008C1|nr:TRAP transporter small permease subunit [Paracoccus sp. SCSIO 75233]WBU52428.1 TRAP transporter small permease subunit [Paracoccus sp. SCSIO 75233]
MQILDKLSRLALIVAGLFLLLMMVHISLDVALKLLFSRPIAGTLEIVSTYYMVAGVFFPIAAVEMARSSISVDAVYQFFPQSAKKLCMVLVLGLSAATYLILACSSWGDAIRSYRIKEQMIGQVFVTIWPSRFVLPIGFGLAGLVCFGYLLAFLLRKDARDRLLAEHDEAEGGIDG